MSRPKSPNSLTHQIWTRLTKNDNDRLNRRAIRVRTKPCILTRKYVLKGLDNDKAN